ncbi:MAG: hypothetical protein PHQ46_11360 [Negativicutes bacterium]|nr:hypothetical protein [Negativicutes bacterium]
MNIQQKAERLLQAREAVNELEAQLKILKAERDTMQDDVMAHLKRQGFASVKTASATITIATKKTLRVLNERELITELKSKGLNDYVCESLNKDLFKPLANKLKKEGRIMAGTELVETEYISIKEPKKVK